MTSSCVLGRVTWLSVHQWKTEKGEGQSLKVVGEGARAGLPGYCGVRLQAPGEEGHAWLHCAERHTPCLGSAGPECNITGHRPRAATPACRGRKLGNEWGFPGGSDGKESAWNAGDVGSIPGSRRHPGEGKGNPLQYSCLENSMDRGAWRAPHIQSVGSQELGTTKSESGPIFSTSRPIPLSICEKEAGSCWCDRKRTGFWVTWAKWDAGSANYWTTTESKPCSPSEPRVPHLLGERQTAPPPEKAKAFWGPGRTCMRLKVSRTHLVTP